MMSVMSGSSLPWHPRFHAHWKLILFPKEFEMMLQPFVFVHCSRQSEGSLVRHGNAQGGTYSRRECYKIPSKQTVSLHENDSDRSYDILMV
jgi:hypothetical protein